MRSDLTKEDERAVLRAVRAVDPSSSEESVRCYWREIVEAEDTLAGVDLSVDAPVASFSPFWERDSSQ